MKMSKNIRYLLHTQYLGYFGINTAIHTKDKKKKRNAVLLAVVLAFSFVMCMFSLVFYDYFMLATYQALGIPEALIGVMMTGVSLLCLITTVMKAPALLFTFRDFDIVMPLPVTRKEIVISKIITLYNSNIAAVLLLMLPAAGVYGYVTAAPAYFWIMLLPMVLVLPVVPMIIGGALGTLISLAARRFRKTNYIRTFLSLLLFAAIMFFSFSTSQMTEEKMADIAEAIRSAVYGTYPLSGVFSQGLCGGSIVYAASFVAGSLLLMYAFYRLILAWFFGFRTLLTTQGTSRGKAETVHAAVRGQFSTLFAREIKRFVGSSLYFVNNIVGVFMLLIATVALIIVGGDKISGAVASVGLRIPPLAVAIAISALASMTNPAVISISLEGASFPLMKSLPVSHSTYFLSKAALSMALDLPVTAVCAPLMCYTLRLDAAGYAVVILFSLAAVTVNALWGVVVNIKLPNFSWTNEITVIKQSAAVFVGEVLPMFVGMAAVAACIFLPYGVTEIIGAVLTVLLLAAAIMLYRMLTGKWGEKKYAALI